MITPQDFVNRWSQSALREQQAAQSHFNELCQLVGHKTPTELDPEGKFFTFEEQVAKATGGNGRADVWYKGHFAWEYKGKHKDLDAAYAQLLAYRGALDNPPLLVVCDFLEYRIYPQWANTSGLPFVFRNEDLLKQEARNFITWLLESPNRFLEERQEELEKRERLTLDLAGKFAHLAGLMREHTVDGVHPWSSMQIARFLTKLVFTLFCEDVDILPRPFDQPVFRVIVTNIKTLTAQHQGENFVKMMKDLFEAMNGESSAFFGLATAYFNGGIFTESAPGAGDGLEVLDLTQILNGVNLLGEVSEADWRFVNPTIFGTLFEGALDISKRAQLGAHYTGESDIRLVVDPVLMQPLYREWDALRAEAEPLMQTYLTSETPRARAEAETRLKTLHDQIMDRLEQTTVLDPACGSGNFLYMSLKGMKDLEGRARKFFEPLGLPFRDVVTPRQLFGIEKDEFAANLAKVVVWIGYLQWRYEDEGRLHPVLSNRIPEARSLPNPIIKDKLHPDDPDRIVCDDAIMRYKTSPPTAEQRDVSPPPTPPHRDGVGSRAQRGGVGSSTPMDDAARGWAHVRRDTALWAKIKPMARQMRTEPTPAEDRLWQALRRKGIDDYKFRRQHAIDRFIVDFYCAEARLVIEVDGEIHDYTVEEDALRTEFIESLGLRVVRFRNDEVFADLDGVLDRIRAALKDIPSPSPSPSQWGGEGGGDLIPYEPDWPAVDVIVGNPPFLGGSKMRGEMGDAYVEDLRALYDGRVPGGSDLVTYWFEKARAQIEAGGAMRAGLLATNSIRGGANREVLKRIKDSGDIFMAWSDKEWVLEGAAVRISIVGFDKGYEKPKVLDGIVCSKVNSDLTAEVNIVEAYPLVENVDIAFSGTKKGGDFDITRQQANELLNLKNKSGLPNSDVVKPWLNGTAIVGNPTENTWIIDFGTQRDETLARRYEAPFSYVETHVYPIRSINRRATRARYWWLHSEVASGLRNAIADLVRYIATPRVSKHRVFIWTSANTVPDDGIYIFARSDDYFFGALHSYPHEIWSLRMGTSLEDRPRYTPTTTFETFPFPWPPGSEDTSSPAYAAISAAAKALHEEREAWLNPPDLIALGADPSTSKALKERTLTNLYNALVAYRQGNGASNGDKGRSVKLVKAARDFAPRLAELHDALDRAVLSAYGWDDLWHRLRTTDGDEELLRRLLALNLERAGA